MNTRKRPEALRGTGPVRGPAGRTPRRRGRWIKSLALAAGIGVILFALWTLYIQVRIGQGTTLESEHKTDVGIVLGASLWNNKPSPALTERLEAAYEGYASGEYPMLIVSGGLDNPRMKLTEAEGMADYLRKRGVPETKILLENEATSTYENLLFSTKIMRERGMETATIVTHQFHGARSEDIADFLGYEDPQFKLAPTEVLNIWQTRGRETLAFTKWLLDKNTLPDGK